MRFLGLDIGTTRIKCGIYAENGSLLYSDGEEYGVRQWERETCLDIEGLQRCVKKLLKRAYSRFPFDCVAISSLGESFVLLDERDEILFPPMLYTDSRGEAEAEYFKKDAEKIFRVSGVYPHGMYSVYKLLRIKNSYRELYERAEKLMLIGDYIGYILTGNRGSDYASASRTGVLDIRKKEISFELCALFGIDEKLFSPVVRQGEIIGEIRSELLKEWETKKSIVLVAGSHDQVCAALGAGVTDTGTCVDGMGTVECMTTVFKQPFDCLEAGLCGYPNVPFIDELYCTYLLNYSCGSLVRWWMDGRFSDVETESGSAFSVLEKQFREVPTGLLVLPYFAGAATPYQDLSTVGGIVGLKLSHTSADVYKGILEGLCMEMRLNLETAGNFGVRPRQLIATGGGAASGKWLQIKADITGLPVYPLESKEAGVCGAAMLGASALGKESVSSLKERFVKIKAPYLPVGERKKEYDELFERYKKLYRTIKNLYE